MYLPGGVPAWGCAYPEGCTCQRVYLPRGVYLPGGVPAGGVPAKEGVTTQGCTCLGGVPAAGVSHHALSQTPSLCEQSD